MTDVSEKPANILTREQLAASIHACLEGRLTQAQLAKWAFDQFYKIEIEELEYEEQHAALLSEVLDQLMFADEDSFQLDEQDLALLIRRLQA